MTTLAQNKPRDYEVCPNEAPNDVPAVTSDIIYEGAAVGESSGYGRPLSAGDNFMGFATRKCDNAAGAAGAKYINVRARGRVKLSVTGVSAVTDEGSTVYASDDDTFTLSSTNNSTIGKIIRWISATYCIVEFEGTSFRSI